MHHATLRDHIQINWANEQLTQEELHILLLSQDNYVRTAWHVAVWWGKEEILDKLWVWTKEVLNTDQLIKKMLMAKNNEEMTAFHHETFCSNVQILERLWKWANEQLTHEELNKLLLAQDNNRQTA